MYPHERSLVKQLADKPFALIGVNSDHDIGDLPLEDVRKIVKEKKLTWRSFQNAGGDKKISDQWKIKGWPTVFILDGEGKIRFKGHGASDAAIETCLAELGYKVKIGTGHEHQHSDENPDSESDLDSEDLDIEPDSGDEDA